MTRMVIELAGDDVAAGDIGVVNNDHDDVAEASVTLDKSSELLFDKCRARM